MQNRIWNGAAVVALAAVLFGLFGAQQAFAQGALSLSNETALSWGTTGGLGGALYDIEVTGTTPLKIHRVGFRPSSAGTHTMDVYYRLGGSFNQYPPSTSVTSIHTTGWVYVGSASVTFPSAAVTQIPVDLNLSVPISGRVGILMNSITATPQYTSSTAAPNFTNADLTMYSQGAKTSTPQAAPGNPPGTPFTGANVPRVIPTTIWYDYDQIAGTHVSVDSVRANSDTGLVVGNNTIQAVLKNMGTTVLDNTDLHAQYSVDGGANWSTTQIFSFPSFPTLSNQTISFTAQWTATAFAATDVRVRLVAPTPIGQGEAMKGRVFTPNLDITVVATNPSPAVLNAPITVSATVNNVGDWSHNGQPLNLRYTTNGGTNYVTQQFSPTGLSVTAPAVETFAFTTPATFVSAGTYTIGVEIFPQVVGDPDTSDSMSLQLDNVGIPFFEFGTGTTGTTLSPPVYRGTSLTGSGNYSVYQMLYNPTQLAGLPPGVAMASLQFFKTNDTQTIVGQSHPLRVWLMNTTALDLVGNETVGTIPTNSGTLVHEDLNFVIPPTIGWINFGPFNQSTPFIYSGGSLLVTVEWVSTGPTSTTGISGSFAWRHDTLTATPATGRGYQLTSTALPATTNSVALSGNNSSTRKPHAKFFYIPPTATDLDVDAVSFGSTAPLNSGPSVGSNTVNVTIKTFGAQAYTGNFNLEYSINGGTNWVTNAPFQASGLSMIGNTQTVAFTTPWVVASPIAPHSLRVRIAPPVAGDPDTVDELLANYTVDADVESVAYTGVLDQLNQPISIKATVRNDGSMSLNGIPLAMRYSANGGANWVNDSFTPTTLGGNGTTQEFTFTTPYLATAAGSHTIVVEVFPALTGDPDTLDSNGVSFMAGVDTRELFVGAPTTTASSAGYPFALNTYTVRRTQAVYLASELTAAGVLSGQAIVGLGMMTGTTTTLAADYPDVRIGLMHTSLSVLPTGVVTPLVSDFTNVIGPITIPLAQIPVADYVDMAFHTPFIWNGTDNIYLDLHHYQPTPGGGDRGITLVTGLTGNRLIRIYNNGATYPWESPAGSVFGTASQVPKIRLYTVPPSNTDLDVDAISFGASAPFSENPQVGSNVVNATVRTFGTLPFTGTYNLEYSTNGGLNWVTNAPFSASGLGQIGNSQTVTFTTQWVIGSPLAPQSLRVRISPPVAGDPDPVDQLIVSYPVDADVDEVKFSGPVYVLNVPITVSAVIKNNGGMSLNGQNIALRYTADSGTNWVNQSFTATSLTANGDTEEFTFTTPVSFATAGPRTITVQILTPLPGDTDPTDENGVTIPNVGDPVLNLGPSDFPGATSFASGNSVPFGNYASGIGYATMWTPQQLRNYQGDILEFGFQYSTVFSKSYTQVRITMGEFANVPTVANAPFLSLYDLPASSPVVVYDGPFTFDSLVVDNFLRIVLQTPFTYTGQNNLGVYLELVGQSATTSGSLRYYPGGTNPNFRWYNTTGPGPNGVTLAGGYCHPASFVFAPPANPGVAVSRVGGTGQINNGATDSLGIELTANVAATVNYTITNRGFTLPLGITSITVTDQVNCTAVLSGAAPTTVQPGGGTANFGVNVTAAAGAYSFKVTILNNTSDTPDQTYVISVTGTGFVNTAPTLEVLSGGAKSILITEVCSDPTGSSNEFIELTNVSAQPVDISGWEITVYDSAFNGIPGDYHAPYSGYPRLITGTILQPGQTWVVADSTATAPSNENLGSNIVWNAGYAGGVMIRDTQLSVVDIMTWGPPAQIFPATITAPVAFGVEWQGPPIDVVVELNNSIQRKGASDVNDETDWHRPGGNSLGQANAGLTLPFGGGTMQLSGTRPNFQLETVSGEGLTSVFLAQDPDSHQNLTVTVTEATGGSITAAAAGFTNTFPFSTTPGGPPQTAVMLGTAAASGTVVFTVSVTDNGVAPLTDVITVTYKIGARLDVDAIESESPFVRVSGQKDFYRGQSGQPVEIRVSNNNPFAITLNSLDFSVQPAGGGAPLTGITINTPSLPMSIPANTTNVLVSASMDIAANASGGNDLACELVVNTGLAVDPAAPTTNPIIVIVGALADEFRLFDGPVPTPMSIPFASLLPAVETVAFLQELPVTGGLGTYTWTITAGTLPTGLTLNASGSSILNASISGTPALASAGPYPITLQVSDGAYLATKSFTLNVSQLQQLAFPPITLANAREYVPYTMTTPLAATGGSLIYTYGIDTFLGDDLPQGLMLNTQTGVITGTPVFLEADSYDLYFTVDDGITLITQVAPTVLVVEAHPLQWNTTVLPTANETVAYSFTLDTIGGTAPRIYSVVSTGALGTLPTGLTLNNQTGVISGVPGVATSGTYTIEFRVEAGATEFQNRTLTLDVVLPPPLTITTAALSYAEIGQPFNIQIAATGGSQNYTFSTGGGVLSIPNSVILAANGTLSGTPEFGQDGKFAITVVVNDGYGTASKSFDFTVQAPQQSRVVITEVDVGTGYIEIANTSQQMPVDMSGWRLVAWIDGNAPTALTFDSIPGASLALPGEVVMVNIGGTAGGTWPTFSTGSTWTATSTSNVAIALYDVHGSLNDFVVIGTVNVSTLVDAAASPADIHPDFASVAAIQSGAANYSLGANGVFTGSAAGSPGVYNTGLATQALDLLKDGLKVAVEGEAYWDFTIATGGSKPYVYSITAPGAAWLSINPATGVLTGTVPASAAGTVVVDLTVTDASLAVVTETVNLTILASTVAPSASFTVGQGEGQSFEGTIISVPVSMSLATGVTGVSGFSFVIDVPAATAAELAVWRVLPGGATLGANRTVIARDIGNNQVFVSDIDLGGSTDIAAGVVAIVQFIVPADDNVDAPEDTYAVNITNTAASGLTTPILTTGVNGGMELSNYAPADVNRDNIIDVVDVQLTVNIILSLFVPTYNGQGDANLDTLVDVVDVQTVVNCILFGGCN